MNEQPMDIDRAALRPGMNRGDSVLLLDQGRNASAFNSCPGRYGVIAILGSADNPAALDALQALEGRRRFVDSGKAAFFAAVPEPASAVELAKQFPSMRFLDQADDWVRAFDARPDGCWVIVNPMLRIIDVAALSNRERILGLLEHLPAPRRAFVTSPPAPFLLLSGVFEPDLCRLLIDVFEREGGRAGTIQDMELSDPRLLANIRARIGRRVCPEIKKAFQFVVSRAGSERVARDDVDTGEHCRHHRGDVGASAAHHRFVLSIPLNDDFDGGEISFPEYSPQGYKVASGTSVAFSASILHGLAPVTRGRRYAFLTFLFDEAAERLRTRESEGRGRSAVQPDHGWNRTMGSLRLHHLLGPCRTSGRNREVAPEPRSHRVRSSREGLPARAVEGERSVSDQAPSPYGRTANTATIAAARRRFSASHSASRGALAGVLIGTAMVRAFGA